jgi:hypothetical protein
VSKKVAVVTEPAPSRMRSARRQRLAARRPLGSAEAYALRSCGRWAATRTGMLEGVELLAFGKNVSD